MANFNNLALTAEGVKALLAAQSGTTLTLSKIGLGSGSTTSSTVNLTGLVTPELMMPISEKKIDSTSGHITLAAKMTNEGITEGFYWRETGLFFEDAEGNDVLFAYSCVTSEYDYIPAYSDQRYVKHIRIANIITDSANIEIKEGEGLLYVDTLTFEEYKEFVTGEFEKKASIITGATTVYVSASGSDDNDGTVAAPLKTIQEAINRCPIITGIPSEENIEMHYTVSVSEGTYAESLSIIGKRLSITTNGTVVLNGVTVSSVGQVTLKGTFHFNNAGANCITLYNSKLYCFGNLKVLAGSIGIILAEGSCAVCREGTVDINNTTWSGVQIGDAGSVYIEELTGTGNTGAGIRCAKGIIWVVTNTLVTSGTGIISVDGGIVNTGTLNTSDKTLNGAINELYNNLFEDGSLMFVKRWKEHGGGTIVTKSLIETITNYVRNDKILNGEFTFFNITYSDGFTGSGSHGLVKYRKHLDDYVTVWMSTENLGTWEYTARFVLGESEWSVDWNRYLHGNDVVDNLLSESTNLPLSAKQGKLLQDQVTELNTKIDEIESINIRGAFATNQDLNNLFDTGNCSIGKLASGYTYKNSPISNKDAVLIVLPTSIKNCAQLIFTDDGEFYYRMRYVISTTGYWTNWFKATATEIS